MNPKCEHGLEAKKIQVKKEGKNKGRWFYACPNNSSDQCQYFEWVDDPNRSQVRPNAQGDTYTLILKKLDAIQADLTFIKERTQP